MLFEKNNKITCYITSNRDFNYQLNNIIDQEFLNEVVTLRDVKLQYSFNLKSEHIY